MNLKKNLRLRRPILLIICLSILTVIFVQRPNCTKILKKSNQPNHVLSFPDGIKELWINIGPNTSPVRPPFDQSVAVLAIEANTEIAYKLRREFQKSHANRFFVINSAVSGPPLAGSIAKFHYYNKNGVSSSLSRAINPTWRRTTNDSGQDYSLGEGGLGFVSVLSLDGILSAIPERISISLLKIDTQGHDFSVISSASMKQLRRIKQVMAETYLKHHKGTYEGVSNDLYSDWIPFMDSMGFSLTNPPKWLKKQIRSSERGV